MTIKNTVLSIARLALVFTALCCLSQRGSAQLYIQNFACLPESCSNMDYVCEYDCECYLQLGLGDQGDCVTSSYTYILTASSAVIAGINPGYDDVLYVDAEGYYTDVSNANNAVGSTIYVYDIVGQYAGASSYSAIEMGCTGEDFDYGSGNYGAWDVATTGGYC